MVLTSSGSPRIYFNFFEVVSAATLMPGVLKAKKDGVLSFIVLFQTVSWTPGLPKAYAISSNDE